MWTPSFTQNNTCWVNHSLEALLLALKAEAIPQLTNSGGKEMLNYNP